MSAPCHSDPARASHPAYSRCAPLQRWLWGLHVGSTRHPPATFGTSKGSPARLYARSDIEFFYLLYIYCWQKAIHDRRGSTLFQLFYICAILHEGSGTLRPGQSHAQAWAIARSGLGNRTRDLPSIAQGLAETWPSDGPLISPKLLSAKPLCTVGRAVQLPVDNHAPTVLPHRAGFAPLRALGTSPGSRVRWGARSRCAPLRLLRRRPLGWGISARCRSPMSQLCSTDPLVFAADRSVIDQRSIGDRSVYQGCSGCSVRVAKSHHRTSIADFLRNPRMVVSISPAMRPPGADRQRQVPPGSLRAPHRLRDGAARTP